MNSQNKGRWFATKRGEAAQKTSVLIKKKGDLTNCCVIHAPLARLLTQQGDTGTRHLKVLYRKLSSRKLIYFLFGDLLLKIAVTS